MKLQLSCCLALAVSTLLTTAQAQTTKPTSGTAKPNAASENIRDKPESYWKGKLSPEVYNVTRCSATEEPFTGKYWKHHDTGTYTCSNCHKPLFDSKDKFDSGTGWPSFKKPQSATSVEAKSDSSHGMVREEVVCKHCGAHLGHVFDDGPMPTGQRYCINSASLDFEKSKQPSH